MKRVLWFILFLSPMLGPDGYLIIPKIDLFKPVVFIPDSDPATDTYLYDLSDLQEGVGHLEHLMWGNTTGGRTVLVGHTPGAFENIYQLATGDDIILSMNGDYYTFTVYNVYVTDKSDGRILYEPSDTYEVVLITCEGADNRRIVQAR